MRTPPRRCAACGQAWHATTPDALCWFVFCKGRLEPLPEAEQAAWLLGGDAALPKQPWPWRRP